MNSLKSDLQLALRQLIKTPGFTIVAILTLALSIGANTAIFSMIEGVLLRPLPFAHGKALVQIGHRASGPELQDLTFSVPELQDYRRQSHTLSGIMEYHAMEFTLVNRGEPDIVRTGVVSSDFFDQIGVHPILGRTLRKEEDQLGAAPVIVLTSDYWLKHFGGDPGIVGQSLKLNGRPITVVGVLPPLPAYPGNDDVFISLSACPIRSSDRAVLHREVRLLKIFGRVKQGVSLAQVQAEISTIAQRLRLEHPDVYQRDRVGVPVVPVREALTSQFRPTALVLLVTVGLVLLIGCANLANLMIARLLNREHEVMVRAALGAGRGRLIRQMVTESLLLALLGGLFGLLLALLSLPLLVSFANRFTPRASEIGIDLWTLLFALVVTLVTVSVFGFLPAFQVTRQNLATVLREISGRSTLGSNSHRLRGLLIVLQVALSFILLVGAGLTLRSLFKLQQVEMGINQANVLTFKINLPFSKYRNSDDYITFFERLEERLTERPGVVSVATATDGPLEGPSNPRFKIEGQTRVDHEEPQATFHAVSPDYFRTLDISLIDGRVFTLQDDGGGQLVAVINQSMARKFWPDQSPLGKRVAMTNLGAGAWRTIVGVVSDVRQHGLEAEPGPGFYYPAKQASNGKMNVLIRTAGDPLRMVGDVRSVVRILDPEQPITGIQTLEQVRSAAIAPSRLTASLLSLFAVLAFLITATGVSGVVAFFVAERTQEIGIRSALGASQASVLGLVLRQMMWLVTSGLIAGLLGAFFLCRLLASLLFGVQPADPVTFTLVALVLSVIVGIACLVPARHATRIDPMLALRS
jgi:predicted permease